MPETNTAMQNNSQALYLQNAVRQAIADDTPLKITGGSSKAFYGNPVTGLELSTLGYNGIVSYHPSELVLTAKAGTSLLEIKTLLAENGQMLAFEPPHFADSATLGGAVACGLSGNRRPFCGSVRDFVLGCKIINGNGEILRFGGEVMKNVAGYDVSRLMVGAMGELGLILEVSLKVLPRPAMEQTLLLELELDQATDKMIALSSTSLPLSGLAWHDSILSVRLSGTEKSVNTASAQIGGQKIDDNTYWLDLNEQKLDFFQKQGNLWRLSVPPASNTTELEGESFYDWGGAQRWLKSEMDEKTIFKAATDLQGHATLFRSENHHGDRFTPLSGRLLTLQKKLKLTFDPHSIFNQRKTVPCSLPPEA